MFSLMAQIIVRWSDLFHWYIPILLYSNLAVRAKFCYLCQYMMYAPNASFTPHFSPDFRAPGGFNELPDKSVRSEANQRWLDICERFKDAKTRSSPASPTPPRYLAC